MTRQEFNHDMKRLRDSFPQQAWPDTRVELIYKRVHDLPLKWWKETVDRMILANNPRLDLEEAIAGYRRARTSLKNAEDIVAAHESMREKMSENGLQHVLDRMGARNLLEAIKLKPRSE